MKTSHQFARELLNGPDIPTFIFHDSDPSEMPSPHDPKAMHLQGYSEDGGTEIECVEIFGIKPAVGVVGINDVLAAGVTPASVNDCVDALMKWGGVESDSSRCEIKEIVQLHLPSDNADAARITWIEHMVAECEGRILTRLFMPDGKPFREKVDAAMQLNPV